MAYIRHIGGNTSTTHKPLAKQTMNALKTIALGTAMIAAGTVIGVVAAPDELVNALVPGLDTPTSVEVLCEDMAEAVTTENQFKVFQVSTTMSYQHQVGDWTEIQTACGWEAN